MVYGNIYHQYTPNVSIYASTMDPMGMVKSMVISLFFLLDLNGEITGYFYGM